MQIVIPQLSKHVWRIDILRIVIKDTLHAGDMSYRAQPVATGSLANERGRAKTAGDPH